MKILVRTAAMKFGSSFVERDSDGGIEGKTIKAFASFEQCRFAARHAAKADLEKRLQCARVIYCQYSADGCVPKMRRALNILEPRQS